MHLPRFSLCLPGFKGVGTGESQALGISKMKEILPLFELHTVIISLLVLLDWEGEGGGDGCGLNIDEDWLVAMKEVTKVLE